MEAHKACIFTELLYWNVATEPWDSKILRDHFFQNLEQGLKTPKPKQMFFFV